MSGPLTKRVRSVDEALELLGEHGEACAPLGGGTWVMRSWQRREPLKDVYVVLDRLEQLKEIDREDTSVCIGALATHDRLARALTAPAVAGIGAAARASAFPAIRSVATVAGNLCADPFPEADLVPALLAGEARVELADLDGRRDEAVEELLRRKPRIAPCTLVERIIVPSPARRVSAYERLTIRGGGEYTIVSVAVSVDLEPDGTVAAARVALGGAEETSRLYRDAAAALVGRPLRPEHALAAGEAAVAECVPREGLDAPAWYRTAVLPALMGDAVQQLERRSGSA
jgi:carbon-monoxide dehydrogenase medium subunit